MAINYLNENEAGNQKMVKLDKLHLIFAAAFNMLRSHVASIHVWTNEVCVRQSKQITGENFDFKNANNEITTATTEKNRFHNASMRIKMKPALL